MAKLTYYERQIIESKLLSKQSARAIAQFLGRDHSVVTREIQRNTGDHLPYTAVAENHRKLLFQSVFLFMTDQRL